jgi:hypothetical protein
LFHHEPTYEDEDIQRMYEENHEILTRNGPPLDDLPYDAWSV